MSYFDEIKQEGEVVRYDKPLHWIIYARSVGLVVLLLLFTAPITVHDGSAVFTGVVVLIALAIIVRALIKRYSTEIIVTDRRVILKTGILMRNTIEINMSKVESVDVNQSIAGRMFGYGSVVIRGTGSSYEPLIGVAAPIELRNSIITK